MIKHFIGILVYLITFTLILVIINFSIEKDSINFYIKYTTMIFGFLFILQFLLFIIYYIHDKGKNIIIDRASNKLIIEKNKKTINFDLSNKNELKAELNISFPKSENRLTYFPWDNFYYLKIRNKNESELITSLILDDLEIIKSLFEIEIKKRFYALPINS